MIFSGFKPSCHRNRCEPTICSLESAGEDFPYPEYRETVESFCLTAPSRPVAIRFAYWFPNLVKLSATSLGLTDGDLQIAVFPSGIEKVDFSDNKLTSISDWSYYRSLREFTVERNTVCNISCMKFPLSLTRLSLAENEIETFPDVSYLRFLDSLNLSSNRLCDVPVNIPTSVREMNLASNQIDTLPDFRQVFSRMEHLNLSSNEMLSSFNPTIVSAMPNLIDLSITGHNDLHRYFALRFLRVLNSVRVTEEQKILLYLNSN